MRLIATLQVSEHFSTSYLGYSSGGKNGTGYMTTEELARQLRNTQGLLELLYSNTSNSNIPSSTGNTNTFSHIGFVVPDTQVVQKRLESYGVTIYKKIGEPTPKEGPFSKASNLDSSIIDPAEFDAIIEILSSSQETYIFAADPEGNMLEIAPQA